MVFLDSLANDSFWLKNCTGNLICLFLTGDVVAITVVDGDDDDDSDDIDDDIYGFIGWRYNDSDDFEAL